MSRPRLFAALALVATLAVGAWFYLQGDDSDAAIDTVAQLHAAIAEGDDQTVRSFVDIEFRLAEMLGEVWTDAPDADRAEAVRQAHEMLDNTTRNLWTKHFATRPVSLTSRPGDDPTVRWVEASASGDDRPSFVWIYRLHQRPDTATGWQVTQREYKIDKVSSNTTRFYPMAVKQIGSRFKRLPTLAEVNANLPSLQGRIRARHITIPKGTLEKAQKAAKASKSKKSATP